jgi:FKBP-type peptidyl-prolyl cis-trans isomerase (trigger factor)
MRLRRGIQLLDEREGAGDRAKKGDSVIYNLKIFLNKGDEVLLNQRQAEYLPVQMIRTVDGYRFVDHKTVLGSREAMAGVEYSLMGMKTDGYRKVRVSPHLAYREEGLGDLIPTNAVLVAELWLRELFPRAGIERKKQLKGKD